MFISKVRKQLSSLSELKILLDELMDIATGEIKIVIPPLIGTLFFPDNAAGFKSITLNILKKYNLIN
ncbi:MAG: hypothetical protein ACQEWV_26305 [Bacillota bacterium]